MKDYKMGKYTDKLNSITKNHYTGSAESGKPSDLLAATAEMAHAKHHLATGNSGTREPSPKLNRLVSNNNNEPMLDLLRDKSNSL
jgi:hypothetical protein